MNLQRLRDGKAVAVLLVLALAVVVLLVQFGPTRSAYSARLTNSTDTAGTAASNTCTGAVGFDAKPSSAVFADKLSEVSGSTTAVDFSGKGLNGTYQGVMTSSTPSPNACPRDAGGSWLLNGSTNFVSTSAVQKNPVTFSEEVWFQTTVAGGLLIGLGSNQTASSGQHDRQTYLNTSGQLVFGTYSGANQVVTSSKSYNDGAWHHVVATMSASTGMRLYADGSLVASNTSYTAPENFSGYWRVGYDTLSGWPGAGSYYFSGSLRFAAVYSSVLTASQVSSHYAAGH